VYVFNNLRFFNRLGSRGRERVLPEEPVGLLEPVQKLSVSPQELMSEGDVDHGFSRVVTKFVVLGEAAGPVQPCEGAFDDPTFGQHLKQVLLGASNHFHAIAEHLLCPVDQRACVAAVDIDLGDGVEAAEQPHQHGAGCNPVLDAS